MIQNAISLTKNPEIYKYQFIQDANIELIKDKDHVHRSKDGKSSPFLFSDLKTKYNFYDIDVLNVIHEELQQYENKEEILSHFEMISKASDSKTFIGEFHPKLVPKKEKGLLGKVAGWFGR